MSYLYRDVAPYNAGYLKVSGGHEIYYEECGTPQGIPAVFIHGGPGASVRWAQRQYFDPDCYRAIFYHQRGCGQSKPTGRLEDNTIEAQLEDLQALKKHLRISQPWTVLGSSWGSALAMMYAIRHPEEIANLILSAVTFADRMDAAAFVEEGFASRFMPENFETYQSLIPEKERKEKGLGLAYADRILGDDEEVAREAAQCWAIWNFSVLVLNMESRAIERAQRHPDAFSIMARIWCHYYRDEYTPIGRGHIWPHLGTLKKLPVHILHGRYDLIAPVENAYQLYKQLPDSTLHVIPSSGHFSLEPQTINRIIDVTDTIAAQYK